MILDLLIVGILQSLPFSGTVNAHHIDTDVLCCPDKTESKYIESSVPSGITPSDTKFEEQGAHQGRLSSNSPNPYHNRADARPYFGAAILAFGVQQKQNGVYGTRLVEGGVFVTEDYIAARVESYARGFYYGTPPLSLDPPIIRILVGTNNDEDPSNGVSPYEAGARWGSLINRIGSAISAHGYNVQVSISAAIDVEPGFGSVVWMNSWISGYSSTATHTYYNFGSADGCYPDPVLPMRSSCSGGWDQGDIWFVSRGSSFVRGVVPQIYQLTPTGGGTTNFMSKQWQKISLAGYSYYQQRKLDFGGVLTDQGTCGGCYDAMTAWNELMDILNNFDPSYHGATPTQVACTSPASTNPPSCHRTDQSAITWSTDLNRLYYSTIIPNP